VARLADEPPNIIEHQQDLPTRTAAIKKLQRVARLVRPSKSRVGSLICAD